ncbi:MAG: AAA family ATPase [Pseudonocardia sp.]
MPGASHDGPRATLSCADPLPRPPRRVLVAGCSGAGKSTLCRELHARLGLPYTELDSLFHGPGWVPRPAFADDVAVLAATQAWVVEWQYSQVRAALLDRADLLVWLDLPRWRVMTQLARRTVARRVRRVELWNGNVEPPLWSFVTDPEHVLRWAWATYPGTRKRVLTVLADPGGPDVVRLRSRQEIRRWLAGPAAALRRS